MNASDILSCDGACILPGCSKLVLFCLLVQGPVFGCTAVVRCGGGGGGLW